MGRAASLALASVPALVGIAIAAMLQVGDRSSCALFADSCVVGPTYRLLHPASLAFNHVFGALVVSAAIVVPAALSVFLAIKLWRRWSDLA